MSKTEIKSFKMLTPEGDVIAPGVLLRSIKPMVGERVIVLNFPDILHFVVEKFDDRTAPDGNSSVGPLTIVMRRDIRANTRDPVRRLALPPEHIANRLRAMLPEALLVMPLKTHLRLSQRDYEALCASEGIGEFDRDTFDALAYEDIALTVATNDGERSQFEGFAKVDGDVGDFAALYVSRRDGEPFKTDLVILRIAELYFAETISRKAATGSLFDHFVPMDTSTQGLRVLDGIAEYLALIDMNIMSARLAAQQLTDLMHSVWQ